MRLPTVLLLQTLIITANFCACKKILDDFLNEVNHQLYEFNGIAADWTWQSMVAPEGRINNVSELNRQWKKWHDTIRPTLRLFERALNLTGRRQSYLLGRQILLNAEDAKKYEYLYNELQTMYFDTEICIPTEKETTNPSARDISKIILDYVNTIEKTTDLDENEDIIVIAVKKAKLNKKGVCLSGETSFNNVIVSTGEEKVAKFAWLAWREGLGAMKEPYKKLVDIKNSEARRIGFLDLGDAWRDEIEIPDIRRFSRELYLTVKKLYKLIHGVARYNLRKRYGEVVDEFGPIPAHLLGELWSQNWLKMTELIIPNKISIEEGVAKLKWNITHMARRAEDFYQSLGLRPMTERFWQHSVFDGKGINCHGSAADMFEPGDFRVIICPESPPTAADLYVLHHEMGHIQYYMAYEQQPSIFRQGANSAFHESIGDAIMLGVYTPQHLHRLGIVNDTVLYTTDSKIHFEGLEIPYDMVILLQTALQIIPHIPFAYVIEEYRWRIFEDGIDEEKWNEEFWALSQELQGIKPDVVRGEEYFDAAARFHVPDDTPYIRYFLSYIIQFQLFEELCKAAVYGHRGVSEDLPDSILLHRCDIYGSKVVGTLLKDFMAKGSSKIWNETWFAITGKEDISVDSLTKYFRPLKGVLEKLIEKNNIPIGW